MPQKSFHKLLFLCTGNYYRSRFAEILFNAQAREAGLPWLADSRGIASDDLGIHNVGSISSYTLVGLEAIGISIERTAHPLSQATPDARPDSSRLDYRPGGRGTPDASDQTFSGVARQS